MKTFETPVCEVKAFEVIDVLTTSTPSVDTCPEDWALPEI